MAMGLGAFTEGLSSGIQTRDRMDIAKQYKEKMRQENAQGAIDLQETYDMRLNEWMNNPDNAGQTEQDFLAANPGLQRYTAPKDPALIRFGKWLGKKTGLFNEEAGAASGASFASPGIAEGSMSMVSQGSRTPDQLWQEKQQGPVPQRSALPEDQMPKQTLYADGGRVYTDEERRKRSYGDYYTSAEEAEANMESWRRGDARYANDSPYSPSSAENYREGVRKRALQRDSSGGGMGEFYEDLKRRAGGVLDDTFQSISNYGRTADETIENFRDADTAYERGEAFTESLGDAYGATMNVAGGVLTDIKDLAGPVIDFGKGAIKWGEGDEAIPTSTEAPASLRQNPEDVGPPAGLGVGEEKKAATDATAPAPRRTDADMADQAIDDGTMMALENLDFRTLTAQGLTPNDLPQMPTGEWVEYRREMMDSLIAKGKDPSEALKITDDMTVGVQMRGIQRYGQQAVMLLNAGLQDEAAMAMSMAFQYLPNGVSVQWANFDDPKTGRAALVARGFDEETGEPTGAPQLMTVERLAVMMEQFAKPEAFRVWTKDNRQLQLDIAKHQETVSHNATMEDIYAYGAETDRINAKTRRIDAMLGGSEGGLKATDIDRRLGELKENMKRSVMYEDDIAESVELQEDLLAIMSVYLQRTGFDAETVTQQVMEQYRAGREQGGAQAGIAAAMALLRPQG